MLTGYLPTKQQQNQMLEKKSNAPSIPLYHKSSIVIANTASYVWGCGKGPTVLTGRLAHKEKWFESSKALNYVQLMPLY